MEESLQETEERIHGMAEKLRIIRLLTNKDVLGCLEKIRRQESRFTDLADVCPSERMRSLRLAKLEDANLIERAPKQEGKKILVVYQITGKGKRILRWIENGAVRMFR